jgi:hypothetical protein
VSRWILVFLSSCILDPVDFSGHPCPCADGYVCDDAIDRCVQSAPAGGDGVVRVENLRAAWRTPNAIRWTWDSSAPDNDSLARYELFLARSSADLAMRSTTPCPGFDLVPGTCCVFDPSTSPELGSYFRPRAGGPAPVRGVFASDLEPNTEYFAVLVATDTGGGTFTSNVAVGRTQIAPIGAVTIADDGDPPGYELPGAPCYAPVTRAGDAQSGTDYLERIHVCVGPDAESVDDTECSPNNTSIPECWANIRTQETALDQNLDENQFELAYLEFWMAIEDSGPSYWSHAGAHLLFSDGRRAYPTFEEITFVPDRGYVRYQIALDQMTWIHPGDMEPSPITFEDMIGTRFDGYRIGGTFANGARIRIDSIAVRW